MKSICISLLLSLFCGVAYPQTDVISSKLVDMGMEQIRVVEENSNVYISLEDNVYRGVTRGVSEIIDALHKIDSTKRYNILIEERGIPKISINTQPNCSTVASYDTKRLVERLKGERVYNSSFGKLALVLYPELFLENSWFDKLYGVAVNISPAMELSLWPGAMLAAQVVVPLYTNMVDEKQYIRPGVIAFRQDLRLANQLYTSFSVGNFTDDRIGVDGAVEYFTKNGSWNFGVRAGLTGSSTFYGGQWLVSQWQRVTWSGWANYFMPRYNLAVKGEIVQMIYGDRGVRATFQRYFKDVSVGFYAMITDGSPNGGFSFSIPLPGQRRAKRDHRVRVTYPEYFTRVYRARNSMDELKGFSYETTPNSGSFRNFNNPQYIKNINKFKF